MKSFQGLIKNSNRSQKGFYFNRVIGRHRHPRGPGSRHHSQRRQVYEQRQTPGRQCRIIQHPLSSSRLPGRYRP